MKALLALATVCVMATPAYAQRARSPADATVFIRLVGSIRLEVDDGLARRTVDVAAVEIGTGSGFVISPHGYVLTNEHVVNGDQVLLTRGAQQIRVTLNVSSIQVCFRGDSPATRASSAPCAAATIVAADPALDLAVLFIGGSDLPYIALGDSDVVRPGLAVEALGYPLGREVEVAKVAVARDFVPDVSTSSGAVSALRLDDAGERRYLQISSTLNPGNSGGPVVTRDGFAVGVVRMRLKNAEGIGFAIPINQVKDFLEARGIDQALPVRRLRLGAFHRLDDKRLGLRLPDGMADISPLPSRVETEAHAPDIALRIDRVLSPWDLRLIERALLTTSSFEPFALQAREGSESIITGSPPLLAGAALATDARRDTRVEFAVVDLGTEKLVARYLGSAEWVAFNESVLRESLASVQAERWGGRAFNVEAIEWSAVTEPAGRSLVPVPTGWPLVAAGPTRCASLPPPIAAATAQAPQDFAFTMRAGMLATGGIAPEKAAVACSSRRGGLGPASYLTRADWLGVSYAIEGIFVPLGKDRLLQLEVSATDDKALTARAVLAAWARRAAP